MFPAGVDVLMLAPRAECAAEVILRACRRFWRGRDCIFQDAEAREVRSLTDPWVWVQGVSKQEFSVYRDRQALASWDAQGGVKANANTMFHFVLGSASRNSPGFIEVAMVFDRSTPAMKAFVKNLRASLLSLARQMEITEAA